jgi:hypothetical protein
MCLLPANSAAGTAVKTLGAKRRPDSIWSGLNALKTGAKPFRSSLAKDQATENQRLASEEAAASRRVQRALDCAFLLLSSLLHWSLLSGSALNWTFLHGTRLCRPTLLNRPAFLYRTLLCYAVATVAANLDSAAAVAPTSMSNPAIASAAVVGTIAVDAPARRTAMTPPAAATAVRTISCFATARDDATTTTTGDGLLVAI